MFTRLWSWLMALTGRVLNWRVNPDGTVDGHYPNGDKNPSTPTASWGDLSALAALIAQRTTGGSFSHDVRQYLSGTGAASATLSVVTVSGDDVATEGWAISTDNLTNPGDNTGAGFFKLGATVSGNTVYSTPLQWSWIAAAPTDTLAPTIPRKLVGVPGSGNITWSWDEATDPHDGSHLGSGVKEYDLEVGGSITVVAAQPGLTSAYTLYTIGSPSPAPGAVQSGVDWSLSGEGMFNLAGGTDRGYLLGRTISGDFTISCYVPAFTGNSSGPRAGIHVRESTAVGSKFLSAELRVTDTASTLHIRMRNTVNADTTSLVSVSGFSAGYIRLNYSASGNVYTVEYSTDDKTYTVAATVTTLSMAATVYAGWSGTSQQVGQSKTFSLQQCALSLVARSSATVAATSAKTARIRARDLASSPNVSAYGALSDPVTPNSSAPLIKFHPGWYPGTYAQNALPGSKVTEAQGLKSVGVAGVGLWWTWKALEPTRGSYNFNPLIAALDTLDAAGLKAWIHLDDVVFGNNSPTAPDYLTTEPGGSGGIWHGALNSVQPMIWNAAILARCKAFWTAMGAAIDTHPALDMISYREADPKLTTAEFSAAGFDPAAWVGILIEWAANAKAAFPHTNIGAPGNFPLSQANAKTLIEGYYALGVGCTGPDVYPQDPYKHGGSNKSATWTDMVLRGYVWNGSAFVTGGTDYRGAMLIANQIQDPDWGRGYTWPPIAFWDYLSHADGLLQTHCYIWPKNYAWSNMAANLQTYWDNSTLQSDANLRFKSFLQAGGHTLSSTPPTFYSGNVDTG